MRIKSENSNDTELFSKAGEAFINKPTDDGLSELAGDDPITMMLLTGAARTVHEAETKFLNENVDLICEKILELVGSDLTDEAFSRHPLILVLRSHGSRRWEDSLL